MDITTQSEKLGLRIIEKATITNVHSALQEPNRETYGKVSITYSNPLTSGAPHVEASSEAYNMPASKVVDGYNDDGIRYFTLKDNKLDGSFPVIGDTSNVAWNSLVMSNSVGYFSTPQILTIHTTSILLHDFYVSGDSARNNYPVDFSVTLTRSDNSIEFFNITNNTELKRIIFTRPITDVVTIQISITKISQPNMPAAISEIPLISIVDYDSSTLMSIDLLEELRYSDNDYTIGGLSANEITIYISNSEGQFYFNNPESPIAKLLKKNRKVVAWLGAKVLNNIEWYQLGVFWTYSWEVPTDESYVKLVAFDTLGLLDTLPFSAHGVYFNKSIGYLFELVLNSAKTELPFLSFNIEEALYDIVIPTTWFANASYFQALSRLASCYPIDVYCSREGILQIKVRNNAIESWHASWSNGTNVTSTTYPTRYTTQPNIVNVNIYTTEQATGDVLVDTSMTDIDGLTQVTYYFASPVSNITNVNVIADATVTYTYEWYSWGIIISYDGTGLVSGVTVSGTSVISTKSTVYTKRNATSIRQDGAKPYTIDSELIQDRNVAKYLADSILTDITKEYYTAEINYTGDISLTLNNFIWYKDGLATPNYYLIKRHNLYWAGYLTGSATLST